MVALRVGGMTCDHCTRRVGEALRKIPGVESAVVTLPDSAVVEGRASVSALREAILDAGYEVDGEAVHVEAVDLAHEPPLAPRVSTGPSLVRVSIPVFGMTCASCVSAVERSLSKVDGVAAASVNLAAQRATIEMGPGVTVEALREAVASVGYSSPIAAAGEDDQGLADRARDEEIREATRDVVIAAPLGAVVMLLSMVPMIGGPDVWFFPWIALVLTTVILALPGRRFLRGLVTPFRTGVAGMDTLVGLGVGAAYLWSVVALGLGHGAHQVYFESAAITVAFVRIGNLMEARARYRAADGLRAVAARVPRRATLVDGREVDIALVLTGDRVRVDAGAAIPVDGVIEEGRSLVDASSLTGEPLAVPRGPGDEVQGGTLAVDGTLVVRATRPGTDNAISRVAALVRQAQDGRAPVQRLADQVAARFVPIVLGIALLTAVVWAFLGGLDAAMVRACAVLLVACPCALGIATPVAVLVGTGNAARKGILFRDAEAMERTAGLKTLILDKTGTLTEGRPRVGRVELAPGEDGDAVRAAVAAVEAGAGHPLARALRALNPDVAPAEAVTVVAGRGVRGALGGAEWLVGSARFLADNGVVVSEAGAGSVVHAARDDRWVATFYLEDPLRADLGPVLARLRAAGLRLVLATGDRDAAGLQSAFGSDVFVRQAPEDKLALVHRLPGPIGMVGDGINDSPALAAADVGFAVGSAIDVARGTARVTCLRDDVATIADAVDLSQRTLRIIRQNLAFAFGYNLMMIPLAAGIGAPLGLTLTPMLAAAAMSMSSVLVVTNSLRLRAG